MIAVRGGEEEMCVWLSHFSFFPLCVFVSGCVPHLVEQVDKLSKSYTILGKGARAGRDHNVKEANQF